MKKLFSIIILCLGCFGFLEAQNIWKPINVEGSLLGVSSDGSIFTYNENGKLARSQDEGETWQIVLGQETGFTGFINSSCFAVSNEGRICVFNDNQQTVVYSDDNGDTWQQTTVLSLCGLPTKAGICAPTNDVFLVWAKNGEIYYTLDGGATWNYSSLASWMEDPWINDLIVNGEGNVYVSMSAGGCFSGGIIHSTLNDGLENWTSAAFSFTSVFHLEFDPEGNVVAGSNWDPSMPIPQEPGFYLLPETCEFVVADNGIIYCMRAEYHSAVLAYSTDHGEHFTEIGEHLPLVDIAPGGDAFFLIKGYDNHLYFDGGGEYWKTILNADEIISQHRPFAPLGAEWYFHVLSQGPITEPPFYYIRHAVTGVAEVQGHLCSVIDDSKYVYEEDNVVYMYNFSTDAFTVMYDFNAEEGDTWYCDIEEGYTCLVTVESVNSVTWNGHTYRTQYVTGYIPDEGFLIYDGRIIEGIGYEKGLFPHEFVFDGTEYDYMRCYLEDGELLYHEGSYDCDYVPGNNPPVPLPEWYYEIKNEDGTITYQYLYQAGDTVVQDEPSHILVKINTLYDKGVHTDVTHEYVYERDGKLYWWNKTLGMFTVLYDFEAEVGDEWEIKVGTESLTMHVDAVETVEYEDKTYRMLHVSDVDDYFSGDIVCGIGHLTSFFPERLMDKGDGLRVEGLRCYWIDDALVFKLGDEDCDAVYSEVHGVEEDVPSTGSGTLAVYPNPTNGVLFVRTHAVRPYEEYRITNIMGQTLLTGQITAETQQIDVSGLPKGMYFISIADETRKFVVR